MRSQTALFLLIPLMTATALGQSRGVPPAPTPSQPDIKTVPEQLHKTPDPLADAPAHQPPPQAQLRPAPLPPALQGVSPSIALDRVHYDRPGDGNLWAKGADYKVRFGADAVRFLPYLGSESPLQPLDLVLESVQVGERTLTFERDVAAEREGDVVHYERGTLTELYVMAPESMEQRFRFDSPLGPLRDAGPGEDLVVRVRATTQLALAPVPSAADPGGFEWTSAHGSVRYGRATVLDAAGASAALSTRFVDGALEIRVPASFLATARYPLTIDPVISTFGVDDSDRADFFADITYDRQTGRWAIVWTRFFASGDWDVWCETRSFVGSFIEGAYIDITSNSWFDARVAGNRNTSQYLVVAEVGPIGSRSIWGRRRTAGSTAMGLPFVISDNSTGEKFNPDIGGDPFDSTSSYYLVVWERVFDVDDHDIHGQLVETDSTLRGGLLLIDNSTADERAPAVSNSNAAIAWTVAYEREFNDSDHDIRAAQISWFGSITEPSFSVDSSSQDDRNPTVSPLIDGTSSLRPYMIAYQRGSGTNRDIWGQVRSASSSVTGSTNLTFLLGSASAFLDQTLPSVECDGSTFVLANSQMEPGGSTNNIAVGTLTLADGMLHRAEQTTLWAGDSCTRVFT